MDQSGGHEASTRKSQPEQNRTAINRQLFDPQISSKTGVRARPWPWLALTNHDRGNPKLQHADAALQFATLAGGGGHASMAVVQYGSTGLCLSQCACLPSACNGSSHRTLSWGHGAADSGYIKEKQYSGDVQDPVTFFFVCVVELSTFALVRDQRPEASTVDKREFDLVSDDVIK